MKYLLFLLALSSMGVQADETRRIKLGAGFGTGFAILGAGAEFETHRMAVLAAVGTFGTDDVAWDVGLRAYLRAADRKMRPHLTMAYAPTHAVKYKLPALDIDEEALVFGYHVLAGLDHDIRKPDGFVMTYGVGWGIPMGYPDQVEKDYDRMGLKPPALDNVFDFLLGVKYQF